MNIPLWVYMLATVATLVLWFPLVRAAEDDPDRFYATCRTGSLLHAAIWMAALMERDLAENDFRLGVFAVNMFFTLFYCMCMRRDAAPD